MSSTLTVTTEEAAERFLASPENNLNTESSLQGTRAGLRRLGNRPLQEWTVEDLKDLCYTPCKSGPRQGLPPADKTVRARKYHMTAFFSWCEFTGLLEEDPARHLDRLVRPGNVLVTERHWLTEEQVGTVLAAVDTSTLVGRRDELIFRLGFGCGLRREELSKLTWGQFDLDVGEVDLVGKGRKRATVKVIKSCLLALIDWHSTAAAALGRQPNGSESVLVKIANKATFAQGAILDRDIYAQFDKPSITGDMIARVCLKYSRKTGIPFTPHDMRRTFAGILEDKGVPLGVIRDCMRHESEAMTVGYLQERPDKAARAMESIDLDF
ncbi:MAG: site-specific integrase [Acidimicrobiales bacterium]|nr:site-specific integrase [Acidimicrobiales bacterium]